MTDAIASVDVGGTFTDVVAWDGASLKTGKVPSTADQSDGVLDGLGALGRTASALRHGTTVATNALLERRGGSTILVTDSRFEDLIEIGRQDRPSLYDSAVMRPEPLVGRSERLGVPGRATIGSARSINDADLDDLVERVAASIPDAVAVSFLYAFADGSAERRVAGALLERLPGLSVSISSGVVAEFREFERCSTTLVNAYLSPETSRYLRSLEARVGRHGINGPVTVMRSSGGLMPVAEAALLPAAILLSGPAGGVVAASALGTVLGADHLVSFDMGGTSTDVCRIDHGRPEVSYERAIDGLPVRMPSVAIHTVGAGGGSIGWRDGGGALRVGPQSAGAIPGPASYGRGGVAPAVTDANVLLGRLASGTRLGGGLVLDGSKAGTALGRLGESVSMTSEATALGMIEVVESHMQRAIRRVSVEQGVDPRGALLVAFGGAGGLHATALARSLDMAGVVVPPHAGVFSALGLLLAPPRADAARSVLLAEGAPGLDEAVADVAARATTALAAAGESADRVNTVADVRYRGQSHETPVEYSPGDGWEALAGRFHRAHHELNGFSRPGDPIEVATVRAEAVGRAAVAWGDLPDPSPSGDPVRGIRSVLTPVGAVEASVWWRDSLAPGMSVEGPAVIEESEATTYLARGERAVVHESGALEVSW